MNILLSAFSCVPGSGSENGNGWNWAYELARSGHRVFLLTSSAGKAKIEAIVEEEALPNLEIIYIEPPHVSKRFGQFQLIVRYFRWQTLALKVAKALVSQRQIDVVHHATMGSIHVGSPLWKLGKPFLFGPVGGGQVAERSFRRYLRGGWGIEVIRSILVRHFTGFIFNAKSTVSNSSLVLVTNGETQEWARRLGAPEVEFMLDVGISKSMLAMESMRRRPEGQCLRILWVGRLLPRKAVLLALEALSRIDQSVCFTCTFIGDGKQGEYCHNGLNS
jgi:glycosyltransferase involved in cell wall biosynthesis